MNYCKKIDQKWEKYWEKNRINSFDDENLEKEKLYCLVMFTYPSAATLHLGHWFNFAPTDTWARLQRMKGYRVFQPMGFDSFGLPAENYAIKTNIHPEDSTNKNMITMKEQLKAMGGMYDWDYGLETSSPEYYKWTQWLFVQLYKHGLTYRKEALVNWCDSCKTVLANEQVIDGQCERCGSEVEKKELKQWFFKITDFADELLDSLDRLKWPEKTKKMQKNWIGRSYGYDVTFAIADSWEKISVFTSRLDTIMGVTYITLAPENKMVLSICTEENKRRVQAYAKEISSMDAISRSNMTLEKSGIFTGCHAIHPITRELIPIWVSEYVLNDYGTGAVMGVPAHDDRDYKFASRYGITIKQVIAAKDQKETVLPYCETGILEGCGKYDGLTSDEAKKIFAREYGQSIQAKTQYKMRDWLVSRQRYWGAPIPIIYCPNCGEVPVPEEDLPVRLPYDVEFKPDGESPLKKCDEFIHTKCPSCGAEATRESDTLDTFVCSSWYYLRYPDSNNEEQAFEQEKIKRLLPVDVYVGGYEHAILHLLYSRFITKFLNRIKMVDFDEPFPNLIHQGLILGPDGNKMSKSKGNTITPDDYVDKYGSDVFRMTIMFTFDFMEGGPWTDSGIKGILRFLIRIEQFYDFEPKAVCPCGEKEDRLRMELNRMIKGVTEDIDQFHFNTAIAKMMEFLNVAYDYYNKNEQINDDLFHEVKRKMILMLAPLAPHFSEEIWFEKMQGEDSIFKEEKPEYIELKAAVTEYVVQVNGRMKLVLQVSSVECDENIEKIVLNDEDVKRLIDGKEIKRVITVPQKLVNIVLG